MTSSLERVNPPALCPPVQDLYAHVVVAPAARTAYLAGQIALDASGELVGSGDHAAQARQAFRNVKLALEGVGAAPADMVRHNIYVVDHRPELVPVIFGAAQEIYGDPWPLAASTLLGVQARPPRLADRGGGDRPPAVLTVGPLTSCPGTWGRTEASMIGQPLLRSVEIMRASMGVP